MKITIRQNTFETNSSSTHTLVYSTDEPVPYTRKDLLDKVCKPSYFGRARCMYTSPNDKMRYIWTAIWELYQDDEEKMAWWKEYLRACIKRADIEFDEIEEIDMGPDFPPFTDVGIDHSEELRAFLEFMENNPDHLAHFILGDSYIETSEYDGLLYALVSYDANVASGSVEHLTWPDGEDRYLWCYIKNN